uniref:Uncharacterized protein n=1 Tax=Arundo donax TaxID=35708 RepID=A0A0A9FPD9_ARUDO
MILVLLCFISSPSTVYVYIFTFFIKSGACLMCCTSLSGVQGK